MVRPKKFLGQHFLTDQNIARRIVQSLSLEGTTGNVLEIGPGKGVLTQYLLEVEGIHLAAIEVDHESVDYLEKLFPALNIVKGDFLEIDPTTLFNNTFSIIGNFPYNISSQILFKVLTYRNQVDQVVCMLQKEVADRIASAPGSKVYGILSVLLQAFYDIGFLFKVPPGVFFPPPKVMSGVIRLKRNRRQQLECDENLFVTVVKQGFNNRRKTLRNALKNLNLPAEISTLGLLNSRAEQLSVEQFIYLTSLIEKSRAVN